MISGERPIGVCASTLSTRATFLLAAGFWLYVTVSDTLYAEGMRVDIAMYTNYPVFASWSHRALQHLLTFPLLFGCYWISVRIGWSPAWRRVPVQVAMALVVGVLPYWLMQVPVVVSSFFTGTPITEPVGLQDRADLGVYLASTIGTISNYGFGLALVTGAQLYRRFHGLQLQNAELQRNWADARLAALRMQLSPHALFNLLHTIQAQIGPQPENAESMLAALGTLLRRLLRAGERDFCLLTDELHFVELYLGLQAQRFADRLTIHMPSSCLQPEVWVPSLILQPLVENAVVHGLANHRGPVDIVLAVELEPNDLRLRVTNSMGARTPVAPEGIGLRNVRERLAVQFGERASLRVGCVNTTQWVADLTLPILRERHATDAPEALLTH